MVARKSLLIISSDLLLRISGWVGLIVLAKLWGGFAPEALGVIGFAMSFIAIFNIFSGYFKKQLTTDEMLQNIAVFLKRRF